MAVAWPTVATLRGSAGLRRGGTRMSGAPLLGGSPERVAVLEQLGGVDHEDDADRPRRGSAFSVALASGEARKWERFVAAYCRGLQRFKLAVLLGWLVLLAAGGYLAPAFLGNTTNDFDAPPGSPSDVAETLMDELFCPCDPCPCPDEWGPGDDHHHHGPPHRRRRLQHPGPPHGPGHNHSHGPGHNHSHGGGGGGDHGGPDIQSQVLVVSNQTKALAGQNSTILGADGKGALFRKFLTALNHSFEDQNGAGTVDSFQTFLGMPPQFRTQFLSADNTAALVQMNINFDKMNFGPWGPHRRLQGGGPQNGGGGGGGGGPGGDMYRQAISAAEQDPAIAASGLVAYEVGMGAFGNDAMTGVQDDLLRMDTVSFPLAFGVMALVLRSLRLLIAPFLCIVCSLAVSFGIVMTPVSRNTDVITYAPAVMMSITLAVSIDYSLFILSRFREEIVQGYEVYDAVERSLATAGHTVLVSGTTLAVAFAGLVFFPTTLLSSVGLSSAVAVCVTVLVNLSLTPALLLTCPNFFGNVKQGCVCCAPSWCPSDGLVASDMPLEEELGASCWHNVGSCTRGCKLMVFVLCALLYLPFVLLAPDLSASIQFDYLSPRTAGSTIGYHILVKKFGAGVAFPNTLLIMCPPSEHQDPNDPYGPPVKGPPTSCVYTQEFWERAGPVVENLATLPGQPHADFMGVMYNPQVGRVYWPEFKAAVMEKDSPLCRGPERGMCDQLRGISGQVGLYKSPLIVL